MDNLKRRHGQTTACTTVLEDYSQSFASVPLHDDNVYLEKPKHAWRRLLQDPFVYVPILLTLLAFWTRFRVIDRSDKVVWDEAHFGKFGSYYLKHEYYFDVHPPLGKMLVGLSGWIAGYNGSFEFESGQAYPEEVRFSIMRLFNAFWGALLVPVAYFTARQFKMSFAASILAATMVMCDTALLCISRFILLDSMLLFFTCASLLCLSAFHNYREQPFSRGWFFWMAMTGLSLGCVLSVKWVGLFAVALVGLYTIDELWDMFGDVQMPKRIYFEHWLARAVCLIVVPIMVYIASFGLHFHVLSKSGPGDAMMPSLFQAQLEGNKFNENPLHVAYGSQVTIKNYAFGGGLLHSHIQTYPEGSRQQQVTCYHYNDQNNDWIIEPASHNNGSTIQFIRNGDIVRLKHKPTRRYLHSQMVPAPVTTDQYEVSAHVKAMDAKNDWRVEIVDSDETTTVRSLMTRFRLRHVELGCLLASDNVALPQWGFRQMEVVCDKDERVKDAHTWWNVEDHINDKLPPAPKDAYQSSFLRDFWHLNAAMWRMNNALIADPDKDDILTSTPFQWPLLSVGLRMCNWADDNVKYYLLGNPTVWWSSFASLLVFALAYLTYDARMRRSIYDLDPDQQNRFVFVGKTLFFGWLLHYFPFFIMGRVTYLHHYFPALYFSILMVPFLLDHFTASAQTTTRLAVFATAVSLVVLNFVFFAPLAYGITGPVTDHKNKHWLKSWNLIDPF